MSQKDVLNRSLGGKFPNESESAGIDGNAIINEIGGGELCLRRGSDRGANEGDFHRDGLFHLGLCLNLLPRSAKR